MVYVNGQHLVTHAGGHLPFEAEVVTADDDGDRWCWWCWRCWWRWWWFGDIFPLRRRLSQHQQTKNYLHRLGSFWLLSMRIVWLWRWTTPSAGKVKNTFDSKSQKRILDFIRQVHSSTGRSTLATRVSQVSTVYKYPVKKNIFCLFSPFTCCICYNLVIAGIPLVTQPSATTLTSSTMLEFTGW